MGVVRINAIGPGAVEYLLHGCDPAPEQGEAVELEAGQELEAGGLERGPERERESGVGYFLEGHGEPAGRWLGHGMEGLGLSYQAGDTANENDLRAIFGELRFPGSQRPGSTSETPVYLGRAPRNYRTLAERVEEALKAEPDASGERQREIELQVSQNSKSNTAYYDVTFSPVKSVSVYYAALLAVGDIATAQAVRDAHDQAVRIAVESAEADVAWAKTGRHGRASASGRTTGRWEKATGLSAVLFAHHTNRDGEPQLHAHVAVLNRVALDDGRVFALDGQAFRPVKDAMAAAYDRAFEAILADLTGVVFQTRPDGKAREIAGIDPALMEEASTRTREHVGPRVEELIAAYTERHGHEPGPRARHAIVDQAVKQTRQPKTGPAGPAAVASWIDKVDGRRDRLEASLDGVDDAVAMAAANGRPTPMATGYAPVATGQAEVATGQQRGHDLATGQQGVATGQQGVATGQQGMATGQGQVAADADREAARAALGATATKAGLAEVQAKYPNWRLGALVAAIDWHLGDDVNAVGLGIDERRAWVRRLAETALDPTSGFGVVQVSMGDPVPVPDELRRDVDGRSMLRAPIDERYATAEHLAVERRVVARAQAGGARRLDGDTIARIAGRAQAAGLSQDQVAALSTILGSERRVEVLVGPAGAGKSHTLGALARAWSAEHGGRVLGTATAEKATRNLAGMGVEAINTHSLLGKLTADEHGRTQMTLGSRDLLIVDEAGMATTKDLDQLLGHAAAAGAKVVWAGDHFQLSAVEAGGLFAHLAERPGAIELETVHRFSAPWEREASLRLRVGDAEVAGLYADEGRLRTGTVEQMEYIAGRDYIADRLEGVSSLLIVGSNAQAAQLSRDIQSQLVELGMVDATELTRLPNGTPLRRGDLIQALDNDRTLRVVGGRDEQGRRREALPVTNRELYTVAGYDSEAGELIVRDERGATAYLPKQYVAESVSLAYAVTNHAAQGVTVDRGRPLADRSMTREALYPASTRGRHLNVIYLVTEVAPDEHTPQRVRDTAETRLVQILERTEEQKDAALTVLEASALEARSLLTLGEHYEHAAVRRNLSRYGALITEHMGAAVAQAEAYPALLGKLRAVELEGHDAGAVLEAAVGMGTFRGSRDLAQVLHYRIGTVVNGREPEFDRTEVAAGRRGLRPAWEQLAAQHRERHTATGEDIERYLADAAERAHARTTEIGAELIAEPTAWALEWLGPVPDIATAPEAHWAWMRDAGQVGAYREFRGIPDNQISIGEAPAPSQQLAHELWLRAAAAGAGDPRAVEWRQASDEALRDAVARWEREQAWAPPEVAAERGDALALAHDARNDATLGRAQLQVMAADDPHRERLEVRVASDELMAEQMEGFAATLDAGYTARAQWWQDTAPQRQAASGAHAELLRRGLSTDTHAPEAPAPEPESERGLGTAFPAELRPEDTPAAEQLPLELDTAVGADLADLADAAGQASAGLAQSEQVDVEVAGGGVEQRDEGASSRHQRFVEQLRAEHEQALDAVDPDGRLDREAREAALRGQRFESFVAELRAEHGERLDPDQRLDDVALAHQRAQELAAARGEQQPRGVDEPEVAAERREQPAPEPQQPGEKDQTGRALEDHGIEVRDDQAGQQVDRGPGDLEQQRAVGDDSAPAARGVDERDELAESAAAMNRAARRSQLDQITRRARGEAQEPEQEPSRRPRGTTELDREMSSAEQLEAGRVPTPVEQARQQQAQRELERSRDDGLELD